MSKHTKAAGRPDIRAARARWRRAAVIGFSAATAAATSFALAMPAGATLTAPANSLIVGSGSSTTYQMMQAMDVLFNDAPGCGLTTTVSTAPQPLDFSCVTSPQDATQTAQEQAGYTENPVNDVAVEEPALGSSSGIKQVQDQGTYGTSATSNGSPINVADNINFARSSRALKSSDKNGLNFVAYAEDGISWFHYTTVSGQGATPSSGVTSLTTAQLQGIWNGTIDNWSQVGGSNAPIVVYSAQEGSGTQSTFDTYLGFDPTAATNPVNCAVAGVGNAAGTNCAGPEVIFENEDNQIGQLPNLNSSSTSCPTGELNVGGDCYTQGSGAAAAGVKEDAVFFFSYGKYELSCAANKALSIKKNANCGGAPLNGDVTSLGNVNGIVLSEGTILAQAALGNSSPITAWPIDRYLFNVYANGTDSSIPVATPATLNYVSEVGFICKPQLIDQNYQNTATTDQIQDPATGAWFRTEIDNVITGAGFFPISQEVKNKWTTLPVDEGHVDTPALSVLDATSGAYTPGTSAFSTSDYATNDDPVVSPSTHDPVGYCYVATTDQNGNP